MMILSDLLKLADTYLSENVTKEDIFILFEDVFSLKRYQLLIDKNINLDENKILPLLERLRHEPISYILNKREFDKHVFYVNQHVLIPRYETEELVNIIKRDLLNEKMDHLNILDVGTGSGCIAISIDLFLKEHNIKHNVYGLDVSIDALKVATLNKDKLKSDITLIESDILSNFDEDIDVLISNPPYIKSILDIDERVINNEPLISLLAPEEGTYFYHQMLINLDKINYPKLIYFEISPEQVNILKSLVDNNLKDYKYTFIKDMNNLVRFMKLEKEDGNENRKF